MALAMSPTGKCAVVLLFTGIAAPIAGVLFRHVAGGWDSIGKGPFAIEQQLPRHPAGPAQPVDPAIQAAEVRQMLVAKSERLKRRGEAPIDVETETTRLLAPAAEAPAAGARQDGGL